MELPEHHFTLAVTPIPSDFFEAHTTYDEVSRALDSRYWETRMSTSCELYNQVCTCTSTLDLEKVVDRGSKHD